MYKLYNIKFNIYIIIKMKPILCLIPARSGSKGVPHKNIKDFNGKPLISWSIEQAKKSKHDMRIIVSTDSEKYAEIARNYGAETPFIRPKEISEDLSTDYEFIEHALNYLKQTENYIPDIVLQLRPTQPCRKVSTIDECLDIFISNMDNYDSLRTVIPFEKSPFKMYTILNNNLKPLFNKVNEIDEPFNQCRQVLPQSYLHNGYIDIFKASIVNYGTISGNNIYPYVMDKNDTIDIDYMDDWVNAAK
jgi:CMP-N,N'-diacetyllegionaminic acid synthase